MILRIDNAAGIIKIGSPPEELPGILESIKINGSLLFENAEIQGRSGKVKVVQGWDDAAVSISLSLIDGQGKTRWDCLKLISGVFKKIADNGKPEIYTLNHPMINAWGAKRLLFSSLQTSENRTMRKISVSLDFVEYDSSAGVAQDRQSNSKPAANPIDVSAARERMLVSDSQRAGLGKQEERFAKF
jgi:hypothetical protein